MVLLKVFWTITAVKQRNHVFEYWNNRNQSNKYSKKLRMEINGNIQILKKHPKIGKNADYDSIKALVMGHFSLFYKYDATQIIIVAFWDNRQDPERLLEILRQK